MFETITPEEAGVPSKNVATFIRKLEKRGATTHGVLFMKGDKIFTEAYWAPFHREFCHRMYSQTKSFVGIAIGLLEEEAKISLDDKIAQYFPEKTDGELDGYLANVTIRELLTMTTAGLPYSWFLAGDPDRTHLYFNFPRRTHPSGTLWQYDSPGSQVLCALVEKVAQTTLLEYLKQKLFNEMNAFQTARILKAPNGDSWGDSAMICTLRDMAALGRFVMNYGVWNGKRLMNEQYLRTATSKLVDNALDGHYSTYHQGYGYQIWRVCGNGFAFVGMGDQLTVCYPDKDLLFACVSDNQGTNNLIREMIFDGLEELIVDCAANEALPQNPADFSLLSDVTANLQLRAARGNTDSPLRKELNGAEFVCNENPMGITRFSFKFDGETRGTFCYANAQGEKTIAFGVNHNVFGKFPQLGYSNEYGATPTTDGFTYDDAVSLAWLDDRTLLLYVQIIDAYLGSLSAKFAFKGDEAYACFSKAAEYFLTEYQGELIAKRQR